MSVNIGGAPSLRSRLGSGERLVGALVRMPAEELVEMLAAAGHDFVDGGQEERLIDRLTEANPGPLSEDGLRALYQALLELVKRET